MAIARESQLMWDLETYRQWRAETEKMGFTPMEMAAQYEKMGMTEYARKLREVIEKMEAAL